MDALSKAECLVLRQEGERGGEGKVPGRGGEIRKINVQCCLAGGRFRDH